MTELSEDQKEEIYKILDEMDVKLKEIRPQCTNGVQKGICDEIEKFLDKHRVED